MQKITEVEEESEIEKNALHEFGFKLTFAYEIVCVCVYVYFSPFLQAE